MKWPHFYPKNCPPRGAKPAFGKFYRLVKEIPAGKKDFKTLFEEKSKQGKYRATVKNCGLSVHTDRQDSEQLKKRVRKFKGHQIAEGDLKPTFGMIQPTPSIEKSHYTWWLPVGAKPWTIFKP